MLRQSRPGRSLGFTMVEMLVIVSLIALLLGLLLPAIRGVRTAARKTDELSAARQLMVAYQQYAVHNNDRVLIGYEKGLPAYDESGRSLYDLTSTAPFLAARYPWRLAPYFDYEFEGLYRNEQGAELEVMKNGDPVTYLYTVSLYPSLGLNSMWLGGHEGLGLRTKTNPGWVDYFGQFYVRTISEVRRPDTLLVFASARREESGSAPVEGSFDISSPYHAADQGRRWADRFSDAQNPGEFGNVSLRYDDAAVAAFVDGHTGMLTENEISDMRHWANRADGADYGLELIER